MYTSSGKECFLTIKQFEKRVLRERRRKLIAIEKEIARGVLVKMRLIRQRNKILASIKRGSAETESSTKEYKDVFMTRACKETGELRRMRASTPSSILKAMEYAKVRHYAESKHFE